MIQLNITNADRDPDETIEIFDLAKQVVDDSESWLDTPHPLFGTKSPRELINSNHAEVVRNLLRSIKHGMAP